jgi:hypothetical protein
MNNNTKMNTIRRRAEVYRRYGGGQIRCACCGETEISFLSIDHINGGGTKQRRENKSLKCLAAWVRSQGYPKDFQILCMNCNRGKYVYGECPHTRARDTDRAVI